MNNTFTSFDWFRFLSSHIVSNYFSVSNLIDRFYIYTMIYVLFWFIVAEIQLWLYLSNFRCDWIMIHWVEVDVISRKLELEIGFKGCCLRWFWITNWLYRYSIWNYQISKVSCWGSNVHQSQSEKSKSDFRLRDDENRRLEFHWEDNDDTGCWIKFWFTKFCLNRRVGNWSFDLLSVDIIMY